MNISRDQHNHVSLGQNYDVALMPLVESELINTFNAKVIAHYNGLDQLYWDYELDGTAITVHYEHYLGVYIIPGYFFDPLKGDHKSKADEIVDQLENHFRTNFAHIDTR